MGCCAACAPIFHTGGMKMNVFELFGTIAIKNRDANAAIQDTTNKAERAGTKIQAAFKKIGEASIKIAKPIIAGATAIGTAYAAAIETTRDYRTAMAQLETTFITNGHSADTAKKTYQDLQAILGDTDKAVEAATALALMTDNEEDLAKWTDICMGIFSVYQGKLPIEGLAEAANETAKVGVVTGQFADALNWAGISEDDFNKKLKACRTEQERQDLIMNTLYWKYRDASDQYKETGASVMQANRAQEKLNAAMAKLGEIGEPIMSRIKGWIADMVNAASPHLQTFVDKLGEIANSWSGVKPPDLSASLSTVAENVSSFATDVLNALKSIFEWATGDGSTLVTIVASIAGAIALMNAPALLLISVTSFLALKWNDVKSAVDTAFNATVDWLTKNVGQPVETFRANVIAPLSEYWNTTVKGAILAAATAVGDFFGINLVEGWDSITNSIAAAWNNVTSAIANAASAVDSFMGNSGSNAPWYVKENPEKYKNYSVDGSHAAGLERVPNDGYIARLHKDEAVLNKADAVVWRGGGNERIEALLAQIANNTGSSQTIMLDSGILAGQLAPAIDARLGSIARNKGRGS